MCGVITATEFKVLCDAESSGCLIAGPAAFDPAAAVRRAQEAGWQVFQRIDAKPGLRGVRGGVDACCPECLVPARTGRAA